MRALTEPHRRHDPLLDQWILVSADRSNRPWQGSVVDAPPDDQPAFDPSCYLCPGNTRANGETNPHYERTLVFTNDFAALRPDTTSEQIEEVLLRAEGQPGTCRVICYHPRHDLAMARMAPAAVRGIVDLWADQTTELGADYRWVQVFENKGEAMGASNPHPHGQIWAGMALPRDAEREDASQRLQFERTGRTLLAEYAEQEAGGPRVVAEDDDWLVVVPFWAAWPFETLVLPKRPARRLADLTPETRDSLAACLVALLTRYDNLFGIPFPYSMGWHQAPFGSDSHDHWQLHAHFYPPMLRSERVRKFMVGYELLAETQRDITPEDAASRLRGVPDVHPGSDDSASS